MTGYHKSAAMKLAEARLEAEARRVSEIKAAGVPPRDCGPAIPVAPARGPVEMFQPVELYPDGENGWKAKPAGFAGRSGARRQDVFARMEAAAARRKAPAPFSPGQVAMARRYHDLVQHHDSGMMKCQAFDDARGGGGGDAMDAWLREGREIEVLRARIGDGEALGLRRVRPSRRGARRAVMVRALVDMVVVGDMAVKEVLVRHGWAWDARAGQKLLTELGAALDRMIAAGGRGG